MIVRRQNIPGVTLTMTEEEGRELAHVLALHLIHLRAGEGGRGISIDEQIEFCDTTANALAKLLSK